ncbi:MAG: WD40 repeat domain-containing protein [Isosphaeraceae bacterium]
MFRNRRHVPALAVIIVAPALFSDCLGAKVPGKANGEATGDPPGSQVVEPGLPTRGLLRIGSDSLRTGGTPSEIAFSPDGKSIAVAEGWPSWVPGVPFFDSRDGRRIKQLRVPDPVAASVKCLAFSNDGTRLIWGESSGNVALWDLTKNRMLLREKLHHGAVSLLRAKLHDEDVECVAFSADGKLMASGGKDGVVHLRQVESPERTMRDFNVGERLYGEASLDPAGAHCLTFTPDGTRLIAGAGLSGSIFIWQVSDGRLLREIDGEAGQIPPQNTMLLNIPRLDRLQVTPDGRQLIVTGHKLGLNPDHPDPRTRQMWVVEVRFLDLETGECVKTLDGGKEPFKGQVAVSRDGKRVALSESNRLRILDPSSRTEGPCNPWNCRVTSLLERSFRPTATRSPAITKEWSCCSTFEPARSLIMMSRRPGASPCRRHGRLEEIGSPPVTVMVRCGYGTPGRAS